MEETRKKKCSLCGERGHNKQTCPRKPIDDIDVRDTKNDFIEEEVIIEPVKERLIGDLLDREAYDIQVSLFKCWLIHKRPCPLKEIRTVVDKGLHTDSVKLYIELVSDINEFY